LIEAVRILARDIQSGDGCANACLLEAAARLEELVEERRSISTLLQKVESLEAENTRLREERRWVPVGERLPEIGTNVLAMGSEGVFQACLTLWGESRRWEALVLDVHGCGCCGGGRASVTHWQPLPPGPEGDA
jgi:hypothetical protein